MRVFLRRQVLSEWSFSRCVCASFRLHNRDRGSADIWAGMRRNADDPKAARSLGCARTGGLARSGRGMARGRHERSTTPALERLALRGIRFAEARATAPWTLASHATMFSGRLPDDLNVHWQTPLRRDFPTLAEYLGSRGYATAGFVANTEYCSYDTGLDRGFTHYDDYPPDVKHRYESADPDEQVNLAKFEAMRPRLERLRRRLNQMRATPPPAAR
jgi:Sulfatase